MGRVGGEGGGSRNVKIKIPAKVQTCEMLTPASSLPTSHSSLSISFTLCLYVSSPLSLSFSSSVSLSPPFSLFLSRSLSLSPCLSQKSFIIFQLSQSSSAAFCSSFCQNETECEGHPLSTDLQCCTQVLVARP